MLHPLVTGSIFDFKSVTSSITGGCLSYVHQAQSLIPRSKRWQWNQGAVGGLQLLTCETIGAMETLHLGWTDASQPGWCIKVGLFTRHNTFPTNSEASIVWSSQSWYFDQRYSLRSDSISQVLAKLNMVYLTCFQSKLHFSNSYDMYELSVCSR